MFFIKQKTKKTTKKTQNKENTLPDAKKKH